MIKQIKHLVFEDVEYTSDNLLAEEYQGHINFATTKGVTE